MGRYDEDRPRTEDRHRHRSRSRERSRERRRRGDRGDRGDRDRDRSRRRYDDDEDDQYRHTRGDDNAETGKPRQKTKEYGSEKKEDEKNEIDDLTKDQRTVFVSQLVIKATERQLRSFFEKVGKVKDVIMIRDKYTNRHKGFAYVEMAELEHVPMVLMLNGTLPDFQRFPILVKASEAEKNFLAKQETAAAQRSDNTVSVVSAPRRRLNIGNLHPKITEQDLQTVLAPFGAVDDVDLVGSGRAIVTFQNPDDAAKAFTKVAGIELGAGEPITVSWAATESAGYSAGDWKLDTDDQGGGMALNPQSRAALMAQLGQRAGISDAYAPHRVETPPVYQPTTTTTTTTTSTPLVGPPSAAFVISNMFDPTKETDPNWRDDIREDVKAECDKYGKVLHIHVDAVSSRGLVHILFAASDGARLAAESLHGRWFAGRLISVSYVDPKTHRLQYVSFVLFLNSFSGSHRRFRRNLVHSSTVGSFPKSSSKSHLFPHTNTTSLAPSSLQRHPRYRNWWLLAPPTTNDSNHRCFPYPI